MDEIKSKKSFKEKISLFGKILLILSTVVSIDLWLIGLTIPFYILGAILIFFTERKLKEKVLWIIMPAMLLMGLLVVINVLGSLNKNIEERRSKAINLKKNYYLDVICDSSFKGRIAIVTNISGSGLFLGERNKIKVAFDGIIMIENDISFRRLNIRFFKDRGNALLSEVSINNSDNPTPEKEQIYRVFGNNVQRIANSKIVQFKYLSFVLASWNEKSVIEQTESMSSFEERIAYKVIQIKK